jgi:CRP/FNR family transcriptional regulator
LNSAEYRVGKTMPEHMVDGTDVELRRQTLRQIPRPESAPSAILFSALARLSGSGLVRLRRGRTLIAQGETVSFGFLMMSGMAMEAVLLPDGRRHVLDLLEAGDLCGVEPDGRARRSAQAATEARLLRFPLGGFRRLAHENREVAEAAAEAAGRRHARAERKLVAIGCLSAEQRTAQLLLWLAERAERDGGSAAGSVLLPLSRADMGDYLGVSGETVCRALSRLKALNLVRMPNAHRFSVPDRRRLSDFVCAGGEADRPTARPDAA